MGFGLRPSLVWQWIFVKSKAGGEAIQVWWCNLSLIGVDASVMWVGRFLRWRRRCARGGVGP
jgi:hypothetical protein